MAHQTLKLMITLDPGREPEAEELEQLSHQLREELVHLDVDAVDLVRAGKAPERAKAGDPVTLGMLLVTLAASGGVLTTLINVIHSWLTRHERHGATLEIGGDKLEVKGISSEEQKRLVEAWLNRHSGN